MNTNSIKKILRKSRFIRRAYYHLKRLVIFPLRFTALKPIADVTFPIRELRKPLKIRLISTVKPYTLCGYSTLSNAYELAQDIERRKLPGSFVECGTWKGGCAATMAAVAHRYGGQRTTWYFDSFEGMPEPTEKDARGSGKDGCMQDIMGDVLKASVTDVEEVVYNILRLPREKNIIIKGWFKDTLPQQKRKIGQITILRLDGDWYESTMTALNELYDQVAVGGYVIIDDYGAWEGCRRAVHEFVERRGITFNVKHIGTYDPSVYAKNPPAYFQKVD